MSNPYFNASGVPAQGSALTSGTLRGEYSLVEAGFDKLPLLSGNGDKLVVVNSAGTALTTTATPDINGGTIDDAAVNLDGGSLVLPQGIASAPTAEGQAYWNTSTDKLTVGTGAAAKEMVDLDSSQTMTNKTLTSPTLITPALGTPASGTLTSCTGLPVSTGISGLGTNVATFLATPSSANLISAVTDETGTGSLVFATSPTLVTPVLGTPTSGNLSNCTADGTNSVGFKHIPQNSQSAAYTLVLGDAGKHIFHPSADTTARIWTIPANASVAYPIGTTITFINQNSAGTITISITTDTLRLAGAGTTGSRTLAANGVATAVKVTSTEWIISGTGLT